MRVQHNIASMNSYRNYNNNTSMINKNLEKLSSGYKINRAGDDAAGLAISEKMRAQITGLEGAQKNAKDGIRLVQTAEGALTEVHSMLNRMVTLAEQSANGTYSNETDREQLQKEVEQLRSEINRIADSSNFNGTKLLDGSLSGTGSTTAAQVKLGNNIIGTKVNATKNAFTYPTTGTNSVFAIQSGSTDAATAAGVGPSATVPKFEYTFSYTDGENGKEKVSNITLEYKTKTEGGTTTNYILGGSGTEYSIGDGTALTLAEVKSAMLSEIKNNKALSERFDVTEASGSFTFTSTAAGTEGARMKGWTMTGTTAAGAQANIALNLGITLGTDEAKEIGALGSTGITLYTGSNVDDAVFTINGQKFAVGQNGLAASKIEDLKSKNVTYLGTQGTAGSASWTGEMASQIALKTGLDVKVNGTGDTATLRLYAGTGTSGSGGLQLQIGDTGDDFNQLQVNVGDVHANALGIGSVDISDASDALTAMDDIKSAINIVSDIRGSLGAIQNRLEHTINNLSVMQENIQDAESTIRDTDVADEMMKYTKNSILVQSAQAMLAQANQQPQGVLQLLQ